MTPDEIRDRTEITDVLYRYAVAIDTKDYDLLESVFTPDAAIDYNVERGTKLPFSEMKEWLRQALRMFSTTHHAITNPLIEIDGDSARSVCYLTAAHVQLTHEGETNYAVLHGHYSDRLVRTSEGWRIRERTLTGTHVEGTFLDPSEVREFKEAG